MSDSSLNVYILRLSNILKIVLSVALDIILQNTFCLSSFLYNFNLKILKLNLESFIHIQLKITSRYMDFTYSSQAGLWILVEIVGVRIRRLRNRDMDPKHKI